MPSQTAGCGSPTCNPKNVALNILQERGRISETIWNRITAGNPFLKALEGTKQAFPAGMGETLNRRVLHVHHPRETDVLAWSRVGGAVPGDPGYSPCCVTYKEIPYGDSIVSACLYQDGWKSPSFCVTDLVFKHQWEEVLQQFEETMSNWTSGIWAMWADVAFQRSVTCATLNSIYGLPEEQGRFPIAAPTSCLSFDHCEEFYTRLRGAGAGLTSAVPGFELIFIGDQQFKKLEYEYFKKAATLGHRHTSGSVDMWFPSLGRVKTIDKFMFVFKQFPRRFRARATGETWEDCIIPHSVRVPSTRGEEERRNPDYYNPNVALYEEIQFFNMAAVNWLTPPEPLATGMNSFLTPQNYSGDFVLFNEKTECDPKAKMGTFFADFMSGMIANYPRRAYCVLALAQHNAATDICPEGCMGPLQSITMTYPALECCVLINDRLQLLVKGTVPDNCPDGSSLFLVDKKGAKFIVATVHSKEAYTADAHHTEGGTLIELSFPTALAAAQTCRSECDGWDYLACLPSSTPSSDPTSEGCAGCSPNTVSSECKFTFEFDSVDGPSRLADSGNTTLVTFSDPDDAADVAADIETWLGANGTVSVTLTDYHYLIEITGANNTPLEKLPTAEITYDAGAGTAQVTAVQTGDCD